MNKRKRKLNNCDQAKNNVDMKVKTSRRPQLPRSCKPLSELCDTSKTKERGRAIMPTVLCGKCKAKLIKNQWWRHNLTMHNNLAWLDGTEKLDDEEQLKKVLCDAIVKRKGNLICEQCQQVKYSVLDYLLHVQVCTSKQEYVPETQNCSIVKPLSSECYKSASKMQRKRNNKRSSSSIKDNDMRLSAKKKTAETAKAIISSTITISDNDLPNKKLKSNVKSTKQQLEKPLKSQKLSNMILKMWQQDLRRNKKMVCNNLGCQFTSKSLIKMKKHHVSCIKTPQKSLRSTIRKFQASSDNKIRKRTIDSHSTMIFKKTDNLIPDQKSSECTSMNSSKIKKQRRRRISTSIENVAVEKMLKKFKSTNNQSEEHNIVMDSFRWTLNFEEKNFRNNLFQEYVSSYYKLLDAKEAEDYIPKHEHSMLVKNTKINDQSIMETKWRTWERFEGELIADVPTFFTGGPIWAMAWLPIPVSLGFDENVSEFIAVGTHRSMDETFYTTKSYAGKNIIQIWNLGNLRNNAKANPKLAYAITHEGATVWSLEWCPSGCYDVAGEPKKMGLLAAACSDGCVRVYSLAFPESLSKFDVTTDRRSNEANYPIYDVKPSLVLIVNEQIYNDNKQTWQVTKLSWSKAKGHSVIVAGFTNGYVALWNLSTQSPFLKSQKGDIVLLKPYRHFFAHHNAVTMVCLVPHGENRFLATAGLDRVYKFWDLEDTTNPKNTIRKSFITDGSWLSNWHCAFIVGDEAIKQNRNFLYCLPIREYTYKYYDMLPMNSTSYTVSTSNFSNGIASGTLAGEVLAMFPHQLLDVGNMRKTLHRKRHRSIVSSVEIVDFEEQPDNIDVERANTKGKKIYDYMPSTYDESKDRFGLNFCDKTGESLKDMLSTEVRKHEKTLTCAMMGNVPAEQHTFTSVNRLSWNPNAPSFQWLAVAYQNGFVRCIPFSNLDPKNECVDLINEHIMQWKSK